MQRRQIPYDKSSVADLGHFSNNRCGDGVVLVCLTNLIKIKKIPEVDLKNNSRKQTNVCVVQFRPCCQV